MKLQIEKLGWLVAGSFTAFMLASGFDATTPKFGVVDVSKAVTSSDMYKKGKDDLTSAFKQRQDVVEFVNTYQVFTVNQANRFRELSLKPTPTTAETTELNKIKSDVLAQDQKMRALQQKTTLTADEKATLEDFGRRAPQVGALLTQWRQDFQEEMDALQNKALNACQDAIHKSIDDIGKAQAFSLVFTKDFAPFGQNDITNDVMKGMNKK